MDIEVATEEEEDVGSEGEEDVEEEMVPQPLGQLEHKAKMCEWYWWRIESPPLRRSELFVSMFLQS